MGDVIAAQVLSWGCSGECNRISEENQADSTENKHSFSCQPLGILLDWTGANGESGYEELLPVLAGKVCFKTGCCFWKQGLLFVGRGFYGLLPHYLSNLLQFYVCVVLQMDCP